MADSTENYRKFIGTNQTGNATIYSIKFKKYAAGKLYQDISLLGDLVYLQITESLSLKILEGILQIEDRNKLFEMSPIVGDEVISIEIRSLMSDFIFKHDFMIAGQTYVKKNPDDKSATLVLKIKSVDATFFYSEFSTSFKDKTISEFVKDFIKANITTLKDDNIAIDSTDGNMSFAFPYQKFVFMLDYLNRYAKTANNEIYYRFFASLAGGYVYKSLQKILNSTSVITFEEDVPEKIPFSPLLFSEYLPQSNFSLEALLLDRGMGITNYYFDPETKEQNSTTQTFSGLLSDHSLGYPYSYVVKTYQNANQFINYQSDPDSNLHKLVMFDALEKQSPVVSINFTGVLERIAGVMVDLKFMDKAFAKENSDENWSGKYLVYEISHMFSKSSYRQNIIFKRYGNFNQQSTDQPSS